MHKIKKRIAKSILINAPIQKVWDVLLGSGTFIEWGSLFCDCLNPVTNWNEGSRIIFKNTGSKCLISNVVLHVPNELIVIEHSGIYDEGKEDYVSEYAREWIGKKESYRVETVVDKTNLEINQDIEEKYFDSFTNIWDKALSKIKELSEK